MFIIHSACYRLRSVDETDYPFYPLDKPKMEPTIRYIERDCVNRSFVVFADIGYHISHMDLLGISYSVRAFRHLLLKHAPTCGITLLTYSPTTFWYTTENPSSGSALVDKRMSQPYMEMFTRIESRSVLSDALQFGNKFKLAHEKRIKKRFTYFVLVTKSLSMEESIKSRHAINEAISIGINICICGVITTKWSTTVAELSKLFDNKSEAYCIATTELLEKKFRDNFFRVYYDCFERFEQISK
ncbi:hypothetical protein Ocin01_17197 [Orchesella cincta]|uniref:Uncharacterized protein n=1 Tax=Orchesella cincta TaxID=48709 RepID=A0A1D2M934_ORCCI|nr:hypothetical protein Ocin01_17197 [Orchesella cincta]